MCAKCDILDEDEIAEVIRQIEAGLPIELLANPHDARHQAHPKSKAPLIVPTFDTGAKERVLAPGSLTARVLTWGFEESWKPGVVFNTRIESAGKPTWRDSMEHRRCVIPVSAFFETHREETCLSPSTGKPVKRSYEFRVPGHDVTLIGCIWKGERFSMVTAEANADMMPIHPRMPLVMRPEELSLWFGPDFMELADRSSVRLDACPVTQASGNAGSMGTQLDLFG